MKLYTHRLPGLILKDHEFSVPLDYTRPDLGTIKVFAREVVAPERDNNILPWLVFFQGGPGYGGPRPVDHSGWLKRALCDYRVLLLDQRGTGRSTPVLAQTLSILPSPQAQADYLKHFRADAIVKDAEFVRCELLGSNQPWSALGQSYGGFCVTHYLSAAPHGLREAIITGGLPPLSSTPDEVYRATYPRVLANNRHYYARYPEDVEQVKEIVDYLQNNEVRLPGGGQLTPRNFQNLGIHFGASDGFEIVHYLLEAAFVSGKNTKELSFTFLREFENRITFETNPIYALLHEAIYCQGKASNWSAARIRMDFPEFEITTERPVYFTGEMVYPWLFDDYEQLRPLKEVAEILAAYPDWPILYDLGNLESNEVPCVAAIYYDDMYVDRGLSEETANHIQGIKLWITNEYHHSALRLQGEVVFDHLLRLLHGEL